MKSRVLKNTEALVRFFYPVIIDWAMQYDYSIPSVSTLLKYTVKFNEVESWKSPYNGTDIDAIGSHNASESRILVASKREHYEIMSTLIHEYAHAVQYFNLGKEFHANYSMEAKAKQHGENKYENEARTLSNKLMKARKENPEFRTIFYSFKFEFVAKPGPKTHLKKKAPRPTPPKTHMRGWYGLNDEESYFYSDTRVFKCNRNSWWLRR